MKAFFAIAAAAAAVAEAVVLPRQASSSVSINTPSSLVTCEPAAITYSGGVAPYFISVYPAGQTSGALEQFPQQASAGTYTWNVNIAANTNVTLGVRDGDGNTNFADAVVIEPGTSTSCVGQSISGSGSASSGSAAATSGTSPTSPTSSGSGSSPTSSAGASPGASSAGSSSAPSSSPSSSKSGAGTVRVGFATLALCGLVALAL